MQQGTIRTPTKMGVIRTASNGTGGETTSTDPRTTAPASLRVTWVVSSQTTPTPQEDPAPTSRPGTLTAQTVP